AQIREILISESAWEEMTCLFAPSLAIPDELYQQLQKSHRMSVHFTSQGQIKMVVSEKALVRA
ncbi:hypothetical protein PO428_20785, partial [Escherichia coli]